MLHQLVKHASAPAWRAVGGYITTALVDEDGALAEARESAAGPVEVHDAVVTQPVAAGAPAGEYTVRWRVTSADGHPITGSFRFTATASGGGTGPASAPSGSSGEDMTASCPRRRRGRR